MQHYSRPVGLAQPNRKKFPIKIYVLKKNPLSPSPEKTKKETFSIKKQIIIDKRLILKRLYVRLVCMKKIPFREYHLLRFFDFHDCEPAPLDLCIHRYFKSNKALGSKDRAWITETVYGIERWRLLIDYLTKKPRNWENRLATWKNLNPALYRNNDSIPLHIRYSFSEFLFSILVNDFGLEKALPLCWNCNFPAPTTIRVNTLKTNRQSLLEKWKKNFEVSECSISSAGIRFHKKINFFQLPEFKSGLFEVQDEGSQILAQLVEAKPGQHVLDYCSGSGGKTLAFAPRMNGQGQIYLHDIRPHILVEAKKRLKRAGIENSQILQPNDPKLSKLKKKFDYVLVDAPCSGTGTLRRNPDMKRKLTEAMLNRFVGRQRKIFEKALSFVKPGGRIVYGTCSILKKENEQQIEHFLKTYPIELTGQSFQSFPEIDQMDGLFGVCFKLIPPAAQKVAKSS